MPKSSSTRKGTRAAALFFETVLDGVWRALEDGRKLLGIGSRLIPCILRDRGIDEALATLEQVLLHRDRIIAIGLDSAEKGNPPGKFSEVFDRARAEGLLTVAHAGEEGPAHHVRDALDLLHVVRIDHGNHALDDPALIERLARERVPLTICPLSNLRLRVVDDIRRHPLRAMMDKGLLVCVNSDDPAYFGGYVNENYVAVQQALSLSDEDLAQLARNSFEAAFLTVEEKRAFVCRVDNYVAARGSHERGRCATIKSAGRAIAPYITWILGRDPDELLALAGRVASELTGKRVCTFEVADEDRTG